MKYRFLWISEDYELAGTNDAALADKYVEKEWGPVYDCATGCWLGAERTDWTGRVLGNAIAEMRDFDEGN